MATKTYGTVSADRLKEMSGLEFVEGLASGALPLNTIAQTLGYDVVEAERGRVAITLDPTGAHLNPWGTVHGGLTATLLDSCMGLAIQSMVDKGFGSTTLEFKISLVRPITLETGRIRAEGKVLNCGKRVGTAEGRVVDGAGAVAGARHDHVPDIRGLTASLVQVGTPARALKRPHCRWRSGRIWRGLVGNGFLESDSASCRWRSDRRLAAGRARMAAETPAEQISAFRLKHGEPRVVRDATLDRIAMEQAKAMAAKNDLSHDALGPFSRRMAPAKAGARPRTSPMATTISRRRSASGSTLRAPQEFAAAQCLPRRDCQREGPQRQAHLLGHGDRRRLRAEAGQGQEGQGACRCGSGMARFLG